MSTTHISRPRMHPASDVRHQNEARAANRGVLDLVFAAAYLALGFVALVRLLDVTQLHNAAAQVATVFSPVFRLVEALGVTSAGVLACLIATAMLFAVQQGINQLLRLMAGRPGQV